MEPGRKRAPCREANAVVGMRAGMGLGLGLGLGVCWRRWICLGGHDPSKRREGRVGKFADGQVPVFFVVHADVGWRNERELRWEGEKRREEGAEG